VIQQLVCEENNRLSRFIVEDKAKVLEMEAIFEKLKGILIFILTNRLKCLLADDERLDSQKLRHETKLMRTNSIKNATYYLLGTTYW
jgi:hypothetical protein